MVTGYPNAESKICEGVKAKLGASIISGKMQRGSRTLRARGLDPWDLAAHRPCAPALLADPTHFSCMI